MEQYLDRLAKSLLSVFREGVNPIFDAIRNPEMSFELFLEYTHQSNTPTLGPRCRLRLLESFFEHRDCLLTLLSDRRGDEAGALAKLTEALALAKPGGGLRFFLDLGEPMHDLLNRLPADQKRTRFVHRLLARFGKESEFKTEPEVSGPKKPQSLIEPLTNRELDVLELAAERLYSKVRWRRITGRPAGGNRKQTSFPSWARWRRKPTRGSFGWR